MNTCALVVDDDKLLLRLVQLNLGKIGIKVLMAEDGQEALRLAMQERPDVILLDIMMPRMDGYEVMRRLKSEKETRNIPVVMLTAKSNPSDRQRSREMGAVAYITKPFRLEELRGTVKRVTKKYVGNDTPPKK
jgi:DNA-binding response OmpR family regulator